MEPIWNELNMERVAGRTVAQAMVESDIPLPAGRETQRILYVQGQIHNDAAHCSAGRVQADGTLTLQMLSWITKTTLRRTRIHAIQP
jgi:molybdenum cofactor biosynthesis enzyme MoaA